MNSKSGAAPAREHLREVVELEVRQLRAIMFTDMLGFSALSQANESLALRLLEEHNKLLRSVFPVHGGREIKSLGDGFLVVFPSTLSAVQCAVEIQKALYIRNISASPDETLHLRIGVHVGDVVHRNGDVYGDGVNIASRLQAMADVGGICISGQVHDQIRNKLTEPIIPLGRGELKNIKLPVDLFRVLMPWERRRSRPAMLLPAGWLLPALSLRHWAVVATVALAICLTWFWPHTAKAVEAAPPPPVYTAPVAAPAVTPATPSALPGITVEVVPDSAGGAFRIVAPGFQVILRAPEPKAKTAKGDQAGSR